jgi:predicted component of type VI protein secretion system
MTPHDDEMTIIRPLAALRLTVRDPSGRVRHLPLASGEMTVGRGEDNGLALDQADPSASRRHATIRVDGPTVVVTDLGSTNGVFINDVKVEQAALVVGDVLRLGQTTLAVESAVPLADATPPTPQTAKPRRSESSKRPKLRLLLSLAALAVSLLAVGLLFFSGSETPRQPAPAAPQHESSPAANAPTTPAVDKPAASPEAVAKAQDHSRQGMFFYNNGQIGLAIAEWEKALALDPQNAQATKWLTRAESERDQLLDKYYREGLAALKYARRDEAKAAFRFVTEHCRSQSSDERCLDAARHLDQLEGNTP